MPKILVLLPYRQLSRAVFEQMLTGHYGSPSKTHWHAPAPSESQIPVKHLAEFLDWAGNSTNLAHLQAAREQIYFFLVKLYVHFQMTAHTSKCVSIIQNPHGKIKQLCANIQKKNKIRAISTWMTTLDLSSWLPQVKTRKEICFL